MDKWKEKLEEDEEYLKFDRIENPPHKSYEVCGLMKLYELYDTIELDAQHDIIYASGDDDTFLTYEDWLYLCRCGFFYDEEFGCFAMFT